MIGVFVSPRRYPTIGGWRLGWRCLNIARHIYHYRVAHSTRLITQLRACMWSDAVAHGLRAITFAIDGGKHRRISKRRVQSYYTHIFTRRSRRAPSIGRLGLSCKVASRRSVRVGHVLCAMYHALRWAVRDYMIVWRAIIPHQWYNDSCTNSGHMFACTLACTWTRLSESMKNTSIRMHLLLSHLTS